ncbi:MAG: PH domain-containing protein [Gemmatimonadaceae bacterium]|nr:PH domain-containing protein [Gloeobacterales cyanobacterium ES-bin-141]
MAVQEEVQFEGRPHVVDLLVNTLLLVTVIWLPLWVGSLVRFLFVRYRITNRRVTIQSGWLGQKRSDVVYREIASVKVIPNSLIGGIFNYGVLIFTTKDGTQFEMKSLPRFRELAQYMEERLDRRRTGDVSRTKR